MFLFHMNWKPSASELRKFGLVLLIGFGLIGAFFHFGILPMSTPRKSIGLWCWLFGGAAGSLGLSGTILARPIYWLWMAIALVIGSIVSRIIVALIYFLVFTPMRILAQLIQRDKLMLKTKSKKSTSYWVDLSYRTDRKSYLRQF